jgi:hypothetical protein
MTPKQMIIHALHLMPEGANFKDIVQTIKFLAAVREGEEDLLNGRIISNEQMKQRLDLEIRQ